MTDQYRDLFSASPDLVFLFDEEGHYLEVHTSQEGLLVGAAEELRGRHVADVLPAPLAHRFLEALDQALRSGGIEVLEYDLQVPTGHRWFEGRLAPTDKRIGGKRTALFVSRDITERKRTEEELRRYRNHLETVVAERTAELRAEIADRVQAEEALRRANRALQVLSECNRVLPRAQDEAGLLQDICRIVVEIGGYRLAWVGYAKEDEAKSVLPVAQAGFEDGYLNLVNITWADTERGRGPTGTAIRTGLPVPARNILTDPDYAPWREAAVQRGYASSLALPLRLAGQTFGALNIYAEEPDAFAAEEVRLLHELADNMAYGIETLRTRAERARAEEGQRRALEELGQKAQALARSNAFVSALNRVSTRIQTTLEPGGVLDALGAELQALELTSVVALLDRDEESLVIRQTSIPPGVLARIEELAGVTLHDLRIPRQRWLTREVIEQRRAVYVPDPISAARFMLLDIPETLFRHAIQLAGIPPSSAVVQLPLAVEDRVIGVLVVVGADLRESDLPALSVFANQVAIAFERQRLSREAADAEILRQLDRLRSELIAIVSHEIRTPLGLIEICCTSLLMEDVEFDRETRRQFLSGIQEETDRLKAIVENLLHMSQMESGQLRLDAHPTDLEELARQVMDSMGPQLAGHRFVCDFPREPLVAPVDSKQIVQVLRNLVSNAIRYSPEAGPITIQGRQKGDAAVVCVRDEGIGIPAVEQEKVFERFYRVQNVTTQRVSGVGLGLSVCRGIVESHGGRICVESEPGEGSSFCFTLPLSAPGPESPRTNREGDRI